MADRKFIFKVWDKLFSDEILGRSAALAYFWVFSLFPLMILLTALTAYIPMRDDRNRWLEALQNVLPNDAYSLVSATFLEITQSQRPGLLSFSIIITIWSTSAGMMSVIGALNNAYGVSATRPWWKERLLALMLTTGLAFFIITALILVIFGEHITAYVVGEFGFGSTLSMLWHIGQWFIVILFVLVGVELIYYFAPNINHEWELFSPGAMFALIFWLIISFGLRFYVSQFTNYNAVYGTLASFMVLMLWLYFTGVAILMGGTINSLYKPFAGTKSQKNQKSYAPPKQST